MACLWTRPVTRLRRRQSELGEQRLARHWRTRSEPWAAPHPREWSNANHPPGPLFHGEPRGNSGACPRM